ncbi:YbhB/YbcL family Raf kinase inhibitor-like protein [Tatlockia sp. PL877]|nr:MULTISPECIES: YbhB/YbcL family Raf kinase inhibitor-like protein [unclassified Legionella]MDI9817840.1 YbhB/YbcL family Raf kinase inhibitor-like protein [Legionella sp. PL877]
MPKKYTCEGADISPALFWQNPPKNTRSFVLIVDDPEAQNGIWVHWLVFNIPAEVRNLTEGEIPVSAISGKNSWGTTGYRGPCPPSDIHRYFFKLYALDTLLPLGMEATKEEVVNAMQNHVIGISEFSARYHKN